MRFSKAKSQKIENHFLQEEQSKLLKQEQQIRENIKSLQNEYNGTLHELEDKQKIVNNFFDVEKGKIEEQLEMFKTNTQFAMKSYIDCIEENYNNADKDFDNKIEKLNKEYEAVNTELESLRATLVAATQARLREEEKKGNLDFYKLQITDIELDDIQKLESIKPMLHNQNILSKLIWSTYFQKQAKALENRVLGEITVIGIYKITDLVTEQCYIGQSVDIAKRWTDHIKAGLGIENSGSNKLYKAMQSHGVWNFTFELLEPCGRELLDEKEKFFISLYQSDKFGLNVTKGNG